MSQPKGERKTDELKTDASQAAGDVRDTAESVKNRASDAARDIGRDVSSGAARAAGRFENETADAGRAARGAMNDMAGGMDAQDMQGMLQERRAQLEGLVRDRPLVAIGAAFVVGYLLGRR
jgi:hypothetical protein